MAKIFIRLFVNFSKYLEQIIQYNQIAFLLRRDLTKNILLLWQIWLFKKLFNKRLHAQNTRNFFSNTHFSCKAKNIAYIQVQMTFRRIVFWFVLLFFIYGIIFTKLFILLFAVHSIADSRCSSSCSAFSLSRITFGYEIS